MTIRFFRRRRVSRVLGPGDRAAVWVQGCPFRCRGCIAPESRNMNREKVISIKDMADWVLSLPDIEGITLSGGEPMIQASSLIELIRRVRKQTDAGVVCFTGFTLEHIRSNGTTHQKALIRHIDLLIDGPYNQADHADRLWRGSANQRLLPLTNRYRSIIDNLTPETDRSAGLEFFVGPSGTVEFAGIPIQPDFHQRLADRLDSRQGIHMDNHPIHDKLKKNRNGK